MKYLYHAIIFTFSAVFSSGAKSGITQLNQLTGKNGYYPFSMRSALVYLIHDGKFLCGGALISPKNILCIVGCIAKYIPYDAMHPNIIEAVVGRDSVLPYGKPYLVIDIQIEGGVLRTVYPLHSSLSVLTLSAQIKTSEVAIQCIPMQKTVLEEKEYKLKNDYRVQALTLGWGKDLRIKRDRLLNIFSTARYIYANVSDPFNKIDRKYVGGMLILGKSLIGICQTYNTGSTPSVLLYYIPIASRLKFIIGALKAPVGTQSAERSASE